MSSGKTKVPLFARLSNAVIMRVSRFRKYIVICTIVVFALLIIVATFGVSKAEHSGKRSLARSSVQRGRERWQQYVKQATIHTDTGAATANTPYREVITIHDSVKDKRFNSVPLNSYVDTLKKDFVQLHMHLNEPQADKVKDKVKDKVNIDNKDKDEVKDKVKHKVDRQLQNKVQDQVKLDEVKHLRNKVVKDSSPVKLSLSDGDNLTARCSKSPLPLEARFDCHPEPPSKSSQAVCGKRGCCWKPISGVTRNATRSINVPFCFFPSDYDGYFITKTVNTATGFSSTLRRTSASGWPRDVKELRLDVIYEEQTRLHFKIYDAQKKRYEVPIETPTVAARAIQVDYGVTVTPHPFGISVFRKSTGAKLFHAVLPQAPLLFSDQLLQLTTATGTGLVYGLGEHKARLLHNSSWHQLVMYTRDTPPTFGRNLYGVHPFYMGLEEDGQAHGIFLLNSNAMEVDLQPLPAATFRTIGGILDFYVLTGPSPDAVVRQYTAVIGRPFMPPYWALGFHLCRFGYPSSDALQAVVDRNRAIQLPYDVQWTDLDYMDKGRDWTYDKKLFGGLPDVIRNLHAHNQKYMIIVDPGISNVNPDAYAPYEEGLKDDIFMKNSSGQLLITKVWPGTTVFPDFTHPKAADWWYRMAHDFHDQIAFDGLWTDMNEPANFVDGSMTGCTENELDMPPYLPGVYGGSLTSGTACASARQYYSTHYNLHSLYGHTEVVATTRALDKILKKRSIVISRSTFPSTGHYGGHWSGDVYSTWEDLHYSIPVMLNFQMYGIPLVGADVCGFNGNTTEELCVRWTQLGAFYPFMRNHNSIRQADQDPAVFSEAAQRAMVRALRLRYALLPYLYTLFYRSHMTGAGVVRPLFFMYPKDSNTYNIDRQFLFGDSLLISPVLEQGQRSVDAYFPVDLWYDIQSGRRVDGKGATVTLATPLNRTNVHLRAGAVIPWQLPNTTTAESRLNPFMLMFALNSSGQASGDLYWDDGESLDAMEKGIYTLLRFFAKDGLVQSYVLRGIAPISALNRVVMFGVTAPPSDVVVNGRAASAQFIESAQVMVVSGFSASLLRPVTITWKSGGVGQSDRPPHHGPEDFLRDYLGG